MPWSWLHGWAASVALVCALVYASAVGAGCASSDANGVHDSPPAVPPSLPSLTTKVPSIPIDFAKSQVHITAVGSGGSGLSDVDACGQCHTDAAAQWRSSAHAFASFNNPVYRAGVMRLRKDVGTQESQFCAGCHDPSLLVDGAMQGEIHPEDPRAHAGITCRTCHGIQSTRPDGNGSYDLDLSEIPIPKDDDPESLAAHRARVGSKQLRAPTLCGSCHRSFLNEQSGNPGRHLVGQDDMTPWMRSAYAGSHSARIDPDVSAKDCKACHMPKEAAPLGDPSAKAGRISSHRFVGGNLWLASMRRDPAQLERVTTMLKTAVSVHITDTKPHSVDPRQTTFDVVVRNEGVGHRFPGGVMDAADTWLEVSLLDTHGATLADSRDHVFASHVTDETGKRLAARETHLFRAGVFNSTIPPRESAVIRYAFDAKALRGTPATVVAQVRYRTRTMGLQEASCRAFRTQEGQAFAQGGLKNVAKHLDPCAQQPTLEIASARSSLSTPSEGTFDTHYAHGQGLIRALQEYVDDARIPLMQALEQAPSPADRAAVLGELAHLAAREGREEEAFAWAEKAEAIVGPHPALSHVRAQVLMSRWRWAEAAQHLERAVTLAPNDDGLFAELAIALGGSEQPQKALLFSQRGLTLQPRDWDLLRVQALSLESLAPGHVGITGANEAFLNVRTPDDAPALRAKCSRDVPGCANERNPVHVHALIPR